MSGSSRLQKSCATHAGSQSSSGASAALAAKLMRAQIISFAVDSEVACPQAQHSGSHEKLTGSGLERAVPLNTAINISFAAAALITTESQRVQAARQGGTTANTLLRARWWGDNLTRKAHTSTAESYETTRFLGDNPGTCFVADTAAGARWASGRAWGTDSPSSVRAPANPLPSRGDGRALQPPVTRRPDPTS